MPADAPHALLARNKFKMLLTMIKADKTSFPFLFTK